MPDWTSHLTEEENDNLDEHLHDDQCEENQCWVTGLFHTIAALRGLVEVLREALDSKLPVQRETQRVDGLGDCVECGRLLHLPQNMAPEPHTDDCPIAALVLTEDDMRKRLEEK